MNERSYRNKNHILVLLIIICVAVFGVCAYMLISYYMEEQRTESAFDALRPPATPDLSGEPGKSGNSYDSLLAHYRDLYDKNSDFVGWLKINGTRVDYPVMQTKEDRDYYLHRAFDKSESSAGTLFASDITDIDRPSDVTILYGHMMRNGSMFGELKEYGDKKYLDKHPVIRFDTLKEQRYYKVFCVFITATNTGKSNEFRYYQVSDFFDKADFDKFISEADRLAISRGDADVKYGDQLLLLSTCEYTHADGRLVILGKRLTMEELWALGAPWNKIPDADGNLPPEQ